MPMIDLSWIDQVEKLWMQIGKIWGKIKEHSEFFSRVLGIQEGQNKLIDELSDRIIKLEKQVNELSARDINRNTQIH